MTSNRSMLEGSSCFNSSLLCGGIRDCMAPSSATSLGLRGFDVSCRTSWNSIFANSFAISRGRMVKLWEAISRNLASGRCPCFDLKLGNVLSTTGFRCMCRSLPLLFSGSFDLPVSSQCLQLLHVGGLELHEYLLKCCRRYLSCPDLQLLHNLWAYEVILQSNTMPKFHLCTKLDPVVNIVCESVALISGSSATVCWPWSDLKFKMYGPAFDVDEVA